MPGVFDAQIRRCVFAVRADRFWQTQRAKLRSPRWPLRIIFQARIEPISHLSARDTGQHGHPRIVGILAVSCGKFMPVHRRQLRPQRIR